MKNLLSNLTIKVPSEIYIKDPESSDLGKKIIQYSIMLIDEIGFEAFTFKKLGKVINSNESSIYRYFESKHKLLLYLTSWYWGWIEYQFVLETYSIGNAQEKLEKAILILTREIKTDSNYGHINELLLQRIIINDSLKSFLTKQVDKENKKGYFSVYKRLIFRVKDIIQEVNPAYPFALSLASTLIEGSLHQYFLMSHFQSITNCNEHTKPYDFFTNLILKTI
jgi:AcrR family transcriptional regulator